MFACFPRAAGAANIRELAGRLAHGPEHVTSVAGGAGFREVADFLLAAR